MKRLILLFALAASALAAQSICPTGVTHCNVFSWTWAQGTGDPATGFHVFRAATCSFSPLPTPVATITGTSTLSYTDSPTSAGNQFCYAVTAYNSAGDSLPAVGTLATTPFQVPVVPSGVSTRSQ